MLKKMLSMLMAVTMLVTCFPAGAVSAVSPEEEVVDVIQTEPEDIPQETPEEDPTEAEETDPTEAEETDPTEAEETDPTEATDPPAVTDPVDIPEETEIAEATTAPAEPSAPIDNPKATKATATSGITGDCTWSLNGTVLTISGNGAMEDYSITSIIPWGSSITSVVIQKGVTSIGSCAFYRCSDLFHVTIPASVTSIGESAFYNCSNLIDIYISDVAAWCGITFGDAYANPLYYAEDLYLNNRLVTKLDIPYGVTGIGDYAFRSCNSLISVTIPDSVTNIGDSAFGDCSSLTSVTIPDSVTSIGDFVFYGCSSLTSAIIGDGVTNIGQRAFSDCSNLNSVIVGNGVTSVGDYAFYGCSELNYNVHDNGLYLGNTDNPYVVLMRANSPKITSCDIHCNTKVIYTQAFRWCSLLTEITVPDSVTCIGGAAFDGCYRLVSITIPFVGGSRKNTLDTYQYPFGYLFGTTSYTGCNATEQYYYGSSTSSTTSSTYYIPSSLKSVTVTGGSILYGAFSNCTKLTKIIIPGGVIGIGERAFYNCSSLTGITIPASVTSIDDYAFYHCSGLTSLTIPDNVTSIGYSAFSGCSNLTSITIPANVTSIGYSAFSECSSLTCITIPDSVTSISEGMFSGCGSLESITIPFVGGSREIAPDTDQYPFGYIFGTFNYTGSIGTVQYYFDASTSSRKSARYYIPTSLKSVTVTGGEIRQDAFVNCSNLTDVTIGNGVTGIGDSAFYDCSSLTSITIPASVTSIGGSAFCGCSGLTSVTLPASVTSIGNYAFSNCSSLTSVTIPDSVTSIGNYAFSNCSSLNSVIIGDSVTSIGTHTFYNCTKLKNVQFNATAMADLSSSNNVFYKAGQKGDGIDVIIGANVTRIPAYLFYPCNDSSGVPKLTSVTIGDSVISIGKYAFYNCTGLEKIQFNATAMEDLSSSNNVFYKAGQNGDGIDVNIGANVTRIPAYLFYPCSSTSFDPSTPKLISVSFEENSRCKEIGGEAFSNCSSLTAVHITDLKAWCEMDLVSYDSNPLVFGKKLYLNGELVTDLAIPDSVTSIGDYAFYNCSYLISVTIPDSVTSIGGGAFGGCTRLTKVNITNLAAWCEISFANGTANPLYYAKKLYLNGELVTDLVIPEGAGRISEYAFYNCTSLTSVTIPNRMNSIGLAAFSGCSSLAKVKITDLAAWCGISFGDGTANPLYYAKNLYLNGELVIDLVIPDSVTSMGDYAFYNYSNLISVAIPDSVTSIGSGAFSGCSGLTKVNITSLAAWCEISFAGVTANPLYYAKNLYLNDKWVTDIVIPNGTTKVGDYAFDSCSSLTSVTIPNSVTSIGNHAFCSCYNLTSVTILDGVINIGEYAFYGCNNLARITIPNSVTNIDNYVFYNCSNLASITIPSSVTSIGNYVFYNCSGLTSITIPDSVTKMGQFAFYKCSGLTSVTILGRVTGIENYTFEGCSKLARITIPDSVTKIGYQAFYLCSNLSRVHYNGSRNQWDEITIETRNECLLNAELVLGNTNGFSSGLDYKIVDGKVTITGYYALTDKSLVIPDTIDGYPVVGIGANAFSGCTDLTEVVIPNSVTSIGEAAFSGCSGLVSITIPFIGANATSSYPLGYIFGTESYTGGTATTQKYGGGFSEAQKTFYIPSALRSVTVTGGEIRRGAFYNCKDLTSIAVPENAIFFGDEAFYNCKALTGIAVPASITSIGMDAFYGCAMLKSVQITDLSAWCKIDFRSWQYTNPLYYGGNLYLNGTLLTEIEIPEDVTFIGDRAFQDYIGLIRVTIHNGVTGIGYEAFCGCENLTSVIFEEGSVCEIVDNGAFLVCTSLTDITLPDSVTNIGSNAFRGCTSLREFVIPAGVTVINTDVFCECTGLTSVTIPEGVTSICNHAFSDCTGLKDIVIPDSLTSMGAAVFSGCTGLVSITIPFVGDSRKTASDTNQYPFGYIFGTSFYTGGTHTTQYYYGSDTSSATSAGYCIPSSLRSVTVTGGEILYGAFYNCSRLTDVTIGSQVAGIGDSAFCGCRGLTNVTLGDGITHIGNSAFYGCTGLTDVAFGNSVTAIGDSAFYNCTKLKSIVIPDSVTSIGKSAFYSCTGLTDVTIGKGVTELKKGAFEKCTNLKKVHITDLSAWLSIVFDNYHSNPLCYAKNLYCDDVLITVLEIPDGIKTINNYAFYNCAGLTDIIIPDSVTYIGDYAFYKCTGLTEAILPDGVTYIGDYAFFDCSKLTNVTLGNEISEIGAFAFSGCTGLKEITIPDSVTSIGSGALARCSGLTEITIPFVGGSRKTATDTYQYPFGYIFGSSSYTGGTSTVQSYYGSSTSSATSNTYYIPTGLKTVTVNGGQLLYGAFHNCKNITTIIIGDDVTVIEPSAFTNCSGLEGFQVSNRNPYYCSVSRVLYNKDKTQIIWAPAKHTFIFRVSYTYANGDPVFETIDERKKAGDTYSAEIPEILGYSTRIDQISGTISTEDVIIDVIYYENAKLNGGACNENITWTLYADGMLVLRGSGEMPDYVSGGAPWAADADKVTAVYLDPRITSIGDYAFENCSNLSFVDYGYSVASIGQYAFSGCSSLTSFKLPESVTVVSAGAFSGCAGLKAVVIPDNITAVGNNAFAGCSELIQVTIGGAVTEIGDGAFSDCKALTQIYFRGKPVALGSNALGSTNGKFVYYYSTVSGWEQEIVDGKWHGYEAIPYNAIAKENFDGTNGYIIKVVDKHNIPLKNAEVKLGDETESTNNDGMAYFVKPTQAQALKIKCTDHITFTDEAFIATKTQLMDVIELSDKPSVVQGVRMNGDSIATSVGVLNCLSGETVKITVSGYSKYAIFQYELYQGDRLIATEKTSANSCTFTVKAESFEEGQNVLVRMHTVDGNSVASALNIDVIRLASVSEEQILGELSGIELAIGFGGMGNYKIPLNLESAGKEKIYTIVNGRSIKVGINLDFDLIKDEKDEKKAKTFLHKMVDDAMKNTKKGKAGLTYNLCGYIEIEYLGNNEYCIKSSYVKMAIGAELSFRAQASWFGIVGVYFKVGLSGEASLDLHITHFAPEEGFQVDDMNFAMEDKLEMEGGAYILWGFGSASVYGSITMGFQVGIIPEFEMESVYLSGELGVKWSLLWGLKKGNKVIAAGDFYRWPEPQRELAKKLYEAQQDPDSYTSNDRAYLENRSEWLTGDYLQTNIYDQVSPEVVTCGDTTMMVWLDDNSQRDSANYQTLYYSLYKNGAWSAPVAVDDNGTFDCEFDVYTDGRKIYVIYTELESQNAGVETLDVSDQSGIEAFVSGVEVCVAVYENGSFSAPVRLTNNNICEMLPCITSVNGKLTATWVETNAVGLNTEAGGSTVRSAVFTDNSWGQQANVADDQNMVSDIVTVCLKGQTYTAYIVDADGSGETEDDQALILKNQNGEAKQLDMGVIAQVSNCLIDNMDALTWYNNGKIYMIADPEQQPVCLVPEMTSVSSNYQIISVAQNQTLLLTVMSNEGGNGTDLYSMYVDSSGSLTSPVRLTQTEGYIGNYSVSYRDEKLMVVFTESFAEISKENINTVTHLRNATLDFYTDITLQNVEFDITAAKPNTELELSFGVKNSGTNAVDGITVNLYDPARKLLYTTQCDVSLASGASDTFKATVILPEKLAVDAYHIEILPQNGMAAATDTNTEDNRTELRLAYADISVEAEQKIVGEKNYLILSVANIGNTASKANIQIYAGDQTGRQIANIETGTKEEDLVEPGETEQYFVDIHALVSENDKMATCVVTSKTTDPYLLNNTDTVVLLHIREEIFVKDPDQVIRNPELSVNTGKFDKYVPQNIAVQITAEADSFRTVEGLTKGRDFTVSNGTVTISSAYLSTLAVGKHTLNFVFDFGYDLPVVRSVVVTVSDSTPIVLGGSIGISGETVVGETVYVDISGLKPATVKLGCIWTVDGETVGSDNYYAIKAADLGKTLKLTVTGVEGYTGSFTAEAVVTLKKPAAPAAPLISKVESGTVTLVKVAGMEYSRDLTAWQDSHVFTDLLPNTAYTFYARKKATDMSLASDAGAGVTVTTLKRTVAAPAAPQVESKTYNSITLAADPAMEYRMEGGGWTDNNVFTGLEPNTVYVFYQRYQETETAYASEASTASFTTLDRTPIGGTVAIEGKPYFGTELTAVLKDFTGDMESISYQWYRDGVAIDGAVNSTYTVTRDDMGKTLEIRVSGTGAYQGELTAQLEIPAYIPGDVNSDGYVNSNDVLYFLRFTLSPGRYPINQSGDMNGDGYVNSNDVLYLLRHTLSPGRYPLYG